MNEAEHIYPVENRNGAWRILGLNLLGINRVPAEDQLLPFKEWLRSLAEDSTGLAALAGGSAVEDGEYWLARLKDPGLDADTNIYCGALFSTQEWKGAQPGKFFASVTEAELLTPLMDECYPSENALVILVNPHSRSEIEAALNSFTGEEELLHRLRQLADWVVFPGHDGDYLNVWSNEPEAERRILACCEAADRAVRATAWFSEHSARLQWGESRQCYVIPNSVPHTVAEGGPPGS